jgi:hypothetical protein
MKEWVRELIEGVEPFDVASASDLYMAPPVDYLVDGLIPLNSAVGLTGFPGTGKTWFALEMSRAVATGTKFLGKFDVRRAPVLFVGNDASMLDYAQQWRRLTLEEYAGYDDAKEQGLRDLNPFDTHVHFLLQSEFNLDDMNMVARVIATSRAIFGDPDYEVQRDEDGNETLVEVTKQNVGLIVMDALTNMTKTSEIDNTARGEVMSNVRLIAENTGASVLLLHHNTMPGEFRTGEEWRGGGAQIAMLDCHFHLTAKNKGLIEFKTKKMRGLTPATFYFDLNVHEPGAASLDFNELEQEGTDETDTLRDDLVGVLKARENAPTTKLDFASALWPKYTVRYEDIKQLKKRIESFLYTYTRAPDAEIVLAVRGTGGRASQYKLTYKEPTSDAGSSDEVGDGRDQESGEEAPGLAD